MWVTPEFFALCQQRALAHKAQVRGGPPSLEPRGPSCHPSLEPVLTLRGRGNHSLPRAGSAPNPEGIKAQTLLSQPGLGKPGPAG